MLHRTRHWSLIGLRPPLLRCFSNLLTCTETGLSNRRNVEGSACAPSSYWGRSLYTAEHMVLNGYMHTFIPQHSRGIHGIQGRVSIQVVVGYGLWERIERGSGGSAGVRRDDDNKPYMRQREASVKEREGIIQTRRIRLHTITEEKKSCGATKQVGIDVHEKEGGARIGYIRSDDESKMRLS